MVLKQDLSAKCVCGRAIDFPGGQIKTFCKCEAIWELSSEGFWSITSFAPILVKPKLIADEYPRYPRCKKRRKAGRRC